MLVGDVAGKGMPAALLMSSLQARVQVVFEDGDDLAAKSRGSTKPLCAQLSGQSFHHVLHDRADPVTGELVYYQRRP